MITASLGTAIRRFNDVLAGCQVTLRDGETLPCEAGMQRALTMLRRAREADASVFLIGNGGSAAICAHMQNDLVNKGGLRAQVLHEPSLLTCMSNDYGYPLAYARLVERFARRGDLLVCISSSGRSANMLEAVAAARGREAQVLTLSGFAASNPLRAQGDLNIWLPSDDFGEVEVGHQLLLHYLADALVSSS
ncbi:SIS domain-containing protein [Pseudogulbenkiania sp. MAI-1]|uniref:D-sedoheptulose-7-phosphate isomerase n=1 Tax=Pseudogulbenkiania sp. MAI-1 TaxID=990370 RepID=UPI00045EBE71|nr:SIS domain-containing protein [Pseudogulbenkiania sp. MAI-1]